MWKAKTNVSVKTYQVVQLIGKFDNVPEFSDGYTFSMLYSTYSRNSCNLKSFCCTLFRERSFFAIKCFYYF